MASRGGGSTRRRFLKQGAAAAAAFHFLPRHVLGGPRHVPPSEKINIALVGAGGQGRSNVHRLFEHADAQVTAIADPCETADLKAFYYRGTAGRKPVKAEIEKHYAAKTPNFACAEYEDFRVMLEKEKSIDAVLCATPDHVHAYVCVLSMRAGKHVYCEKPLTHDIAEARIVAQVARDTKRATQMGNTGHSSEGIRETCERIWSGALGAVRRVHAWVPAKRWNPTLTGAPKETVPTPPGLAWDLWLGPRDPRPFHPAYHPVAWRDFWAFGGSHIGDFGCHDLDAACWALELKAPRSIEFEPAGVMDAEIAPHGCVGRYDFGSVKIDWYDGGLKPERPAQLPADEELPGRGVLFVGEKGTMLCGGAGGAPRLLGLEAPKPAPTLPRSKGHHRDWLDAIKGGPPASSNFEYGARLTELALLGVLALRTGRRIEWDPEAMKAKGFDGADEFIREPRRKGWELA
jgi:predicted dehydrogenase